MNLTRKIPLSRGMVALVDDTDFEDLNKYKWSVNASGIWFYAVRVENNNKIWMHRVILNPQKDEFVDHVNCNGLDNTRSNLRICSHSKNMANRRKIALATSNFKGVGYYPNMGKWRARIRSNGKMYSLGLYDTEKEAAMAYNNKALEVHGQFAQLNIIN